MIKLDKFFRALGRQVATEGGVSAERVAVNYRNTFADGADAVRLRANTTEFEHLPRYELQLGRIRHESITGEHRTQEVGVLAQLADGQGNANGVADVGELTRALKPYTNRGSLDAAGLAALKGDAGKITRDVQLDTTFHFDPSSRLRFVGRIHTPKQGADQWWIRIPGGEFIAPTLPNKIGLADGYVDELKALAVTKDATRGAGKPSAVVLEVDQRFYPFRLTLGNGNPASPYDDLALDGYKLGRFKEESYRLANPLARYLVDGDTVIPILDGMKPLKLSREQVAALAANAFSYA